MPWYSPLRRERRKKLTRYREWQRPDPPFERQETKLLEGVYPASK